MAKKQWLGLTIEVIFQIASSPTAEQEKFQSEFQLVYDALTKPKAEFPPELKKEMLFIRKLYKRNAQTGRGNRARPPVFITQGADIFAREQAIANSRPKKEILLDLEFWLDPEFMRD